MSLEEYDALKSKNRHPTEIKERHKLPIPFEATLPVGVSLQLTGYQSPTLSQTYKMYYCKDFTLPHPDDVSAASFSIEKTSDTQYMRLYVVDEDFTGLGDPLIRG